MPGPAPSPSDTIVHVLWINAAAASMPVQAAAGFLREVADRFDFGAPPFSFPARYRHAQHLASAGIRVFPTTSVGRLFDAVAALAGFTRPVTFEGQAAIWLEHLARSCTSDATYLVPYVRRMLDYRPALTAVIEARLRGEEPARIARAFHNGFARGVADAVLELTEELGTTTVALSGGVFQNALLVSALLALLTARGITVLTNRIVPANDGGISLGQAALAAASGAASR